MGAVPLARLQKMFKRKLSISLAPNRAYTRPVGRTPIFLGLNKLHSKKFQIHIT